MSKTAKRRHCRLPARGADAYNSRPLPIGGAVAQLGERLVRNEKVRSSILLGSTNFLPQLLRGAPEGALPERSSRCTIQSRPSSVDSDRLLSGRSSSSTPAGRDHSSRASAPPPASVLKSSAASRIPVALRSSTRVSSSTSGAPGGKTTFPCSECPFQRTAGGSTRSLGRVERAIGTVLEDRELEIRRFEPDHSRSRTRRLPGASRLSSDPSP